MYIPLNNVLYTTDAYPFLSTLHSSKHIPREKCEGKKIDYIYAFWIHYISKQ